MLFYRQKVESLPQSTVKKTLFPGNTFLLSFTVFVHFERVWQARPFRFEPFWLKPFWFKLSVAHAQRLWFSSRLSFNFCTVPPWVGKTDATTRMAGDRMPSEWYEVIRGPKRPSQKWPRASPHESVESRQPLSGSGQPGQGVVGVNVVELRGLVN